MSLALYRIELARVIKRTAPDYGSWLSTRGIAHTSTVMNGAHRTKARLAKRVAATFTSCGLLNVTSFSTVHEIASCKYGSIPLYHRVACPILSRPCTALDVISASRLSFGQIEARSLPRPERQTAGAGNHPAAEEDAHWMIVTGTFSGGACC